MIPIPGRVAQLWDSRPQFVKNNPLIIGAGLLGAVPVNQMLGDPVGGLLDTITFGTTNFREDEIPTQMIPSQSMPPPVITQQSPVIHPQQMSSPTAQQFLLNEEDKARTLTNLKRKIATDLITIHALKGMPEDV